MQKEYRHCQCNLVISGAAVISFGVWNFLKVLMIILFQSEDYTIILKSLDMDEVTYDIVGYLLIGIAFLDVFIRFKVGRAAAAYAKGEKNSRFFIGMGILFMAFSVMNLFFSARDISEYSDMLNWAFTQIVEISSFYASMEMVKYGKNLKKWKERLQQGAVYES